MSGDPAGDGHGEAVAQVLLRAHPRCIRAALRWLRGKCPWLPPTWHEWAAEEAFYRTAIQWLTDPSLAHRDPLPYCLTTVRNLLTDHLRSSKPIPTPRDPSLVGAEDQPWARAERIAQEDARLLEEEVIPAIGRMPRTQRRDVLELQSRGADDTAIALDLGISRGQVQSQRARGIPELRQELKRRIRLKEERTRRQRGERYSSE
ncbi:hypothetical protein [Streptomyces sp. NPDC089919]|uniref:RNA polymerase sigma factor n=1 Tax=Streptomyces sp. NPDC089919 TaxID=3155188 RepID=UPI0034232297